MKRSHLTLLALSLLLSGSLLLGLGGNLAAQPFGGHHGGGPGREFFSNLTDEQRDAIHELMDQMRAEGAAREDIHAAISELFAEWGIEIPERPGGPRGRRGDHRGGKGFRNDLTEDQRSTLHSTMLQMWQDGATREEIHEAMAGLLEGWGIEPPGDDGDRGPGQFGSEHGGFWPQLTDEERDVIRETVDRLRDQGASPEQIHDALAALLEQWGIELPENENSRPGPGEGGWLFPDLMAKLNKEQRKEIHQLLNELRQQGASHDEIRAAVEGRLAEWGIELPEPPPELTLEQRKALRAVIFELWQSGATGEEIRSAAARQFEEFGLQAPEHGPGGKGHGLLPDIHGCLKPSLTPEQRETIHQTIKELRDQGISPEEIHETVRALMSDFGIEVPDLDIELSDEQRAALRTTILDLWLAGASREAICDAVRDLLDDFGIELPEESGGLSPAGTSDMVPVRAQNYPNPANPETQINYTLGVSDDVKIKIYNISGQLVRTYDIGYQPRGSYSVQWDGRHQNGQPVASGIYFYRIQAGPHAVTNRIVLLR